MSKKNKKSHRLPAETPSDVAPALPKATAADLPKAPPPENAKPEPKKAQPTYADPGAARGLPAPSHVSFRGGEKVRLKKTQEYADGTVQAGEVGMTMNPSSQAACWVVLFPKAGSRVVPEWLLERVEPARAAH
jgi:hypothetical protein